MTFTGRKLLAPSLLRSSFLFLFKIDLDVSATLKVIPPFSPELQGVDKEAFALGVVPDRHK